MFEFDRPRDPTDARFRLAEVTRQVIAELASSTASPEAFTTAMQLVEQAAAVLAESEHGRGYEGGEASLADYQSPGAFLDFSPFVGPLNPLAPPIEVEIVGAGAEQVVIGRARYGDAYEGPPSCVHGGFIAAGFDEVLGFAQSLSGRPGMTGRLEISYRSPTPLHQLVRFEGRIDRVEGRKIFASATLHHEDRLCAEASGLFISMQPEVFQRLMKSRAQPAG